MWISKAEFELWKGFADTINSQLTIMRTKNVELERSNSFLQASIEWMRTRLNQVELLNARVLEKELQIPVGVPTITREIDVKGLLESAGDMFRDPEQAKFSENTE